MAQTYTKDKIDELLQSAGGDKIYRHTLTFRIGTPTSAIEAYGFTTYYSTKSTAYTKDTLEQELNARGANNTGIEKGIPVQLYNPPSSSTLTSIYICGQLWGGGVLRCTYYFFKLQDTGFRLDSSFTTVQYFTDYVSEL